MSKKKSNRIKQKRKTKRKIQKQKKRNSRAWNAKNNVNDGNNVLTMESNIKRQLQNEVNETNVETNFETDQKPSTSRGGQKRISPVKNKNKQRSPWRNADGKVNSFKKIVDDQAKKLVKRSIYLIRDNQTPIKSTTRTKRYFNNRKIRRNIISTHKSKDILTVINLEEEEICTHDESVAISTSKDNEEDEDDCIVIEPNVDEITIEDDNDNDNLPLSNDVTTTYQSLVHSFEEKNSSTPCHKNYSDASVVRNSETDSKSSSETLPYFVDICGLRAEVKSNSADTLIDYSQLSVLGDKSVFKHRKVRLKEKSTITDLDDSPCKEQSLTLKGESCEEDDSVIFVSETNVDDFISIVDDTIPPQEMLQNSEQLNTPVSHQHINKTSLFTASETKKLSKYNENAYNPSGNKTLTSSKRMVIIDGSNVAFKHGLDQTYSVKGLKIAIEYFEKMGHEVKAVIPQFRMKKSSDPEELQRLHKAGKIVQTPCKNLPGLTSSSYDDRFILQLAFELDAAIVSNDNYRDLLHENPAFNKIIQNRVIGYTWCNDIFILPKDPYGKWGPALHKILNR